MQMICRNCGLLVGELDLAGCTRDTINAHDFVDPTSRPYREVDEVAILERYARARTKARSSAVTADHFRRCPEGGPQDPATALYEHKTVKRTRLASMLWAEVMDRWNEGDEKAQAAMIDWDFRLAGQPSHDKPFHLKFQPTCFACRWEKSTNKPKA